MSKLLKADIAIFGAGIAGLWTLARLLQAGYSAVLFEKEAIGGIQTIASQGIIHGGTKYALTGSINKSAQSIADMPEIWRNALAGRGELDLRGTRLLAEHQHLWSSQSMLSRMTGFFASKAMRSKMQQLNGSERPLLFQNPAFKGALYQLNEPVLDVASLVQRLTELCGDHIFKLGEEAEITADGCHFGDITLNTKQLIFAAGKANATLLQQVGQQRPEMQLRPLHMVMLRGKLPALHAHALGTSANPRLTITSYPLADGQQVWNLGGEIAELGNGRSQEEQIEAGKEILAELLPWLDQQQLQWATYRVDRAEIKTTAGRRPDDCFVEQNESVITIWPTKLAFAPRVAQEVLTLLDQSNIQPEMQDLSPLQALGRPPQAKLPWQRAESWS
ncbi:MAG: FAD-binding oxidoreductase [Candidatus Polarisedimenticolaceae bacterium]|nr:FAD-binding oxidoreductase [Candidatus Polarisedimenticolaceae bacterium]